MYAGPGDPRYQYPQTRRPGGAGPLQCDEFAAQDPGADGADAQPVRHALHAVRRLGLCLQGRRLERAPERDQGSTVRLQLLPKPGVDRCTKRGAGKSGDRTIQTRQRSGTDGPATVCPGPDQQGNRQGHVSQQQDCQYLQEKTHAKTQGQIPGRAYRDGQTQRGSVRKPMPMRIKDYLMVITGLCLCLSALAETPSVSYFSLLSRSSTSHMEVALDKEQRRWVEDKRELVLGTSAPDYPPFDMTVSGHDYEGITADYAGILAKALGLPIKVQSFATREAAISALEQGRIDLLGSANGFEAVNKNIALSTPYAIDQPVLVTREDETRTLSDGLAGMRL